MTDSKGEKVKTVIEVKNDGSCLLFVKNMLVKKYKRLDACLVENDFYEFLSKEYSYDEYRN